MMYRIDLRRDPHETILTFTGLLDPDALRDVCRLVAELGGDVVLVLDRGSGVAPGCVDLLRAAGIGIRTTSPYLRALLDGTWPADLPGSEPEELT